MAKYYGVIRTGEYLMHHGIKGQKWGVRRYQNKDGTRTPLGNRTRAALRAKQKAEGYTNYHDSVPKPSKNPHLQAFVSHLTKDFKYSNYKKLQSPEETARKKSGSCHDQMMYEMAELKKMGYNPHGKFIFEHDGKGHGGMTHSFAWFKNHGKYYWVENAWSERAGIHEYPSEKAMIKDIKKAHQTGEYGDKSKYSELEIADFDASDHRYGENLQEFVDRSFNSSRNKR
jgi:hypothetical protein